MCTPPRSRIFGCRELLAPCSCRLLCRQPLLSPFQRPLFVRLDTRLLLCCHRRSTSNSRGCTRTKPSNRPRPQPWPWARRRLSELRCKRLLAERAGHRRHRVLAVAWIARSHPSCSGCALPSNHRLAAALAPAPSAAATTSAADHGRRLLPLPPASATAAATAAPAAATAAESTAAESATTRTSPCTSTAHSRSTSTVGCTGGCKTIRRRLHSRCWRMHHRLLCGLHSTEAAATTGPIRTTHTRERRRTLGS